MDAAEVRAQELFDRRMERKAQEQQELTDLRKRAERAEAQRDRFARMLEGLERLQAENKAIVDRVQGAFDNMAVPAMIGAVHEMGVLKTRAEAAEAALARIQAQADGDIEECYQRAKSGDPRGIEWLYYGWRDARGRAEAAEATIQGYRAGAARGAGQG